MDLIVVLENYDFDIKLRIRRPSIRKCTVKSLINPHAPIWTLKIVIFLSIFGKIL